MVQFETLCRWWELRVAKFAHGAWKFEDIAEEHFCEKPECCGVGFEKFFGIVKRGVSLHADMVGPRPYVRRNSMVSVQPLQTLKKCNSCRDTRHRFGGDVQGRPIHGNCGVPLVATEGILTFEVSVFYRIGRMWRSGWRLPIGPNFGDAPLVPFNIALGGCGWVVVAGVTHSNKGNWIPAPAANSHTIPRIHIRMWRMFVPFDVECNVLRRAMRAIATQYRHA
jgi:hypothetical protein